MKLRAIVIGLLASALLPVPSRSQEVRECRPEPDAEIQADMLAMPETSRASREDSVNYRIAGKVRSITDGDSIAITARRNARFVIRLSDMDTPETSHRPFTPRDCTCGPVPFHPGQAGGREATEALQSLLSVGDDVVAECYELDDYGRSVCHVFKGRLNVNLEMIRRGWGWLPERRAWIRDEASLDAERAAKAAGRGAWALAGQVSPADWRTQCWRGGRCGEAVNWPDQP